MTDEQTRYALHRVCDRLRKEILAADAAIEDEERHVEEVYVGPSVPEKDVHPSQLSRDPIHWYTIPGDAVALDPLRRLLADLELQAKGATDILDGLREPGAP